MSIQSIIEHRANYYFTCLREDYLQICLQCTYKKQAKKNHASAHCKAFILDILEHWTNDKRGKEDDLWVFMSNQQWIASMYGLYKYNAIIDSLDELLKEGLIFRKPYKMFGRDTWQYYLNAQEVNKRMRALPDRSPHILEPQVDLMENQRDESQSFPHPLENQRDPLENQRVPLENQHVPLENQHVLLENQHNIDSSLDSDKNSNINSAEEEEAAVEIATPAIQETVPPPPPHLKNTDSSSKDTTPPPTTPSKKESPIDEQVKLVLDEYDAVTAGKCNRSDRELINKVKTLLVPYLGNDIEPKRRGLVNCRRWLLWQDEASGRHRFRTTPITLWHIAEGFSNFLNARATSQGKYDAKPEQKATFRAGSQQGLPLAVRVSAVPADAHRNDLAAGA